MAGLKAVSNLKFTEAAVEAIIPRCFSGNVREAITKGVAPSLIDRADSEGNTYAMVAGKFVYLKLIPTTEEGIEVIYVHTREAK